MKTSNIELLAEIDSLEFMKGVDAKDLEVVKRIDELELAYKVFWIVTNKNAALYFLHQSSAIEFMSKQSPTSGFKIIATTFADI